MPELPPDVSPGQLVSASLYRIAFERHPEWSFDEGASEYSVDFETVASVPTDGRRATVDLKVSIVWNEENGKIAPFDLALTVSGAFEWLGPEIDSDVLVAWLRTNGLYLLWPYVRQRVSAVTADAGLPPLYLETLVAGPAWDSAALPSDPTRQSV